MAEQRQFVLIGNFQDNITQPLERVNKTLDKTLSKLERFHTLGTVITGDFKSMAAASRDFQSSLKGQAKDINQLNAALKRMSTQMGKVNRAYKAGGRRYVGQAARAGGGGGNGPRPPKGGGGARGGGGSVTGGVIAGELITGAIVNGFRIGVSLMEAPFRYFANALQERIGDEISDLKAAAGFFSIAKRQENPFVKTFDEALAFSESNNALLAKISSALPGSTQEYVEVSKRLGDTISRVVTNDVPKAVATANKLITQSPELYGGELIKGVDAEAQKKATQTLLANLTTKTVLAGFGDSAGARNLGAYGLPGLSERLLSQEQVSVGQFQRYSAIFRDPQILDALQRNIGKLNATGKDTSERYEALNKLFEEVLPPELIEKYRRSTAGIVEAFNSALLNPEVGLFGLGRKIKGLGYKMNDFGQYVDKTGKVVDEANRILDDDLSLFKVFKDTIANLFLTLQPLVKLIPSIFDPIGAVAKLFAQFREVTARFYRNFNAFYKGYQNFAKGITDEKARLKFLENLDVRASLDTFAALFEQFGILSKGARTRFNKILQDPNATLEQFASIANELFDSFLQSDKAGELGKAIGLVIGTVINQVGKLAAAFAGIGETNKIVEGIKEGFKAGGGYEGIKNIIRSLIKLMFDTVTTLIQAAPLEAATIGGAILLAPFIPQIVTGLLGSIATAFTGLELGAAVTAALASPAGVVAIVGIVAAIAKAIEKPAEESYKKTTATNNKNRDQVIKNLQTGPAPGQDENTFVRDNLLKFVGIELFQAVADFGMGFIKIFAGLFDIVVGMFSDPQQVADGINKLFEGLWKLLTGAAHLVVGLLASVPAILVTLAIALKNLVKGIAIALNGLKDRVWNWLSSINPFKWGNKPPPNPKDKPPPNKAYGGIGTAMMRELAMAPKGSKLVIANSSETILPAGYGIGAFGGGGNTYGDIVVTVNAGSTQDPESLASLVALKISNAVNDQRSSYFV